MPQHTAPPTSAILTPTASLPRVDPLPLLSPCCSHDLGCPSLWLHIFKSYPLFQVQLKPRLLKTFLDIPLLCSCQMWGRPLLSNSRRMCDLCFPSGPHPLHLDECFYVSVLSLILIHFHLPAPFSTLTTAGQSPCSMVIC